MWPRPTISSSLDRFLPWLRSAHDTALVGEEVVKLFRVAELVHHITVSKVVEAEERHEDLGVALSLRCSNWPHLESLVRHLAVHENGSGQTELDSSHEGSLTTLGLDDSLPVKLGSEGLLLGGSSIRVERNILVLHFY